MKAIKSIILASGLVLLSGCSTISLNETFDNVANVIQKRESIKVIWAKDEASEAEVKKRVSALLSQSLTPDSVAEIALLNSKRIQASYEALGIQRAELLQAGLLSNPIFEVRPRFPSGGGGLNLELGLSQNIFQAFFIPLRRRMEAARLELVEISVANEVVKGAVDAKKAYYEYQGSLQALDVIKQVLKAADAQFEAARKIHEAGNITDLDFRNNKVQLEETKLELLSSEADVEGKKEALLSLLGLDRTIQLKLSKKLELPPTGEIDSVALEDRILKDSLELRAAKLNIAAITAEEGLSLSQVFPEGEVGISSERDIDGSWATGPNFLIPLPIFDQGQAFRAGLSARLRSAVNTYAALEIEKRASLRKALKVMEKAKAKIMLYKKSILPLREAITHDTQTNYNAMLTGVFELLTAKRSEIEAAQGFIENIKSYWIENAEVQQLLGANFIEVFQGNKLATEDK